MIAYTIAASLIRLFTHFNILSKTQRIHPKSRYSKKAVRVRRSFFLKSNNCLPSSWILKSARLRRFCIRALYQALHHDLFHFKIPQQSFDSLLVPFIKSPPVLHIEDTLHFNRGQVCSTFEFQLLLHQLRVLCLYSLIISNHNTCTTADVIEPRSLTLQRLRTLNQSYVMTKNSLLLTSSSVLWLSWDELPKIWNVHTHLYLGI